MRALAATEYAEEKVSELFLRVARELELLRQRGVHLEQSLCAGAMPGVHGANVRDLQEIDYMLQHLAGLRDYLSTLASAAPDKMSVDPARALERIRLSALRCRLSGDHDAENASNVVSGECEMF